MQNEGMYYLLGLAAIHSQLMNHTLFGGSGARVLVVVCVRLSIFRPEEMTCVFLFSLNEYTKIPTMLFSFHFFFFCVVYLICFCIEDEHTAMAQHSTAPAT